MYDKMQIQQFNDIINKLNTPTVNEQSQFLQIKHLPLEQEKTVEEYFREKGKGRLKYQKHQRLLVFSKSQDPL